MIARHGNEHNHFLFLKLKRLHLFFSSLFIYLFIYLSLYHFYYLLWRILNYEIRILNFEFLNWIFFFFFFLFFFFVLTITWYTTKYIGTGSFYINSHWHRSFISIYIYFYINGVIIFKNYVKKKNGELKMYLIYMYRIIIIIIIIEIFCKKKIALYIF